MTKPRLLILLFVVASLLMPTGGTWSAFSSTAASNANLTTAAYTPPACFVEEARKDNPVGYWRFNETSGTSAADTSGTGNTGTYTGGYTLNQTNTPLGDPANRSVLLNGSTGYVNVPNSASLQTGNNFTYEAWIRVAGQNPNNGYRTIMWKGTGAYLGVHMDGSVDFWDFNTNTRIARSITKITDTKWHHVVLSKSTGSHVLYLDGVFQDGNSTTPTIVNNTSPLIIGQRTNQYFNGNMDEVAVYNYALPHNRVLNHFNAGRCHKDEPRADSPISIWRLGENAGDGEAFDSRGPNVGAFNNGPTLQQASLLDGDSTNSAVDFDGVDDRIDVPDSASLKITGNMTLETWFKLDSLPATGATRLIGKGGAGTRNYGIWVRDDGWIDFNQCTASCGTTMTVSAPAGTVSAGKTYHVVATLSGTTRTLYLNGVQVGQTTTSGTVTTSTEPLVIGKSDQTGPYFDGTIDEAAIYSGALSATRVRDHYIAGRSYQSIIMDSGPSGYWRLGENTGATTAVDQTGATNGTYSGTPTAFLYNAINGGTDFSTYFDGTDDQVILGNTTALQASSGTIESWVWNNNGSGALMDVFNKSLAYGLYVSSNTLQTYDYSTNTFRNSNATVPNGQWVHVAMTFQSGITNGTRLYLNGALVLTTTLTIVNQTNTPGIGAFPNQQYMQGTLDEVAFYKKVLPANELAVRYAAGLKQPR